MLPVEYRQDNKMRQCGKFWRYEAMRQILAIAYIDGFFAPLEREMVDRVAHIWNWSTGEIDRILQESQEFNIKRSSSNKDEQSNLSFHFNRVYEWKHIRINDCLT